MEIYHVGDTYPPIDMLLERDDIYIDPSGATDIVVNARINGVHSIAISSSLSDNVYVVLDGDGKYRVRIMFVANDLSVEGVYQLQAILTWPDGTETTPDPYDFKVIPAWT